MVVYCCVNGCNSSSYKKKSKEEKNQLQFFGIPSNPIIKEQWMQAFLAAGHSKEYMEKIKCNKVNKVCSLHFSPDCIEKIGLACGRLKKNSVPTLFPLIASTTNTDEKENSVPILFPLFSLIASTANTNEKKNSVPTLFPKALIASTANTNEKKNSVPTLFPKALIASTADTDENTLSNAPLVQMDIRQQSKDTNVDTVSAKRMCYAGDIDIKKVGSMSPTTIAKSMNILKKTCERKSVIIKRLRTQLYRQKRKIESLKALLSELQTKGLLSPTSSDIVQMY